MTPVPGTRSRSFHAGRSLALLAFWLGALARPGAAQTQSPPVFNPTNGHWYQAVRVSTGMNWYEARDAAAALSYAGLRGHLVTITSLEEQQFVASQLPVWQASRWWMGAYQDPTAPDYREPEGGWRWVTGEPWGFTFWYPREPNNDGNVHDTGENAAEFDAGLGNRWNDYPNRIRHADAVGGYLVEYDGFRDPSGAGPNLLLNGSFETPAVDPGAGWAVLRDGQLPGWRITRADVAVVSSLYWLAAPGNGFQSLDLAGGAPGTIEQSFATVPGQEYLFSGWMSHNLVVGSVGGALVSINGQPIAQLVHGDPQTSRQEMRWVPFAHRFRASSGITTLVLADLATRHSYGAGLVLDGLSVTVVGDPSYPGFPSAPVGLTVRLIGPTQVEVAWTEGFGRPAGYEIERREGSGAWNWIATIAAGTNRFADFSVRPGVTYIYRVHARGDTSLSGWSNEATVTTLPGP